MRQAVLIFFAFCLLLVGGCRQRQFKPVLRPHNVQRIVSLSPSTTELVAQFNGGNNLVGRTAADNYPPYIAKSGTVVATTKPDYEKIAALNPDAILYDASLYDDQELDKLKSAAPKAVLVGISANTVEGLIQQLYHLGSVLGAETTVNDYVDRILTEEGAATASPITPTPRVAVIMPGISSPDYIAGTGSFVADAVKSAGGQPVGPSAEKFVQITPEALVALNPDVIIVPGSKTDLKGALALVNNSRYKTLKAVQDGRVKVINEDILLRRGSRVDQLIKGLVEAIAPAKKK